MSWMNKILDKTRTFIFSQQKSIFSSAMIISTMIIISSFVSFLRYRVLSSYFPKEQLDLFFASFRIPDLIFEILITGALTTSFIPIFIKYQKNKEELDINMSSIINLISLFLVVFIIISLIFLDQLIPLITPGYSQEKIQAIINFSRILLIGQLPFFIIGNFLTGIAQSNKSFIIPALAPIVYNLSIIITTYFFAPTLKLTAPIVGVSVGAILFLLVQLPIIRSSGFNYRLIIKKTSGLIEFFRMIIPRTLTVIIAQIDATIDLSLTSLLGGGAYTVFYLAQHLQLLPVSVLGIAIGQASLPYLSELFQENKIDEFKKIVTSTIFNLFFLIIPISGFLIFARTPLVRFFFGGQMFDWEATVLTAFTLSYFAFSVPFHGIYYFLTRCFYAVLDSRTPFFIGVGAIVINLTLSLLMILVFKLPVWSLALAFSSSMIINVTLLYLFFYKKIGGLELKELVTETFKIASVSLFSCVISYYLLKLFDGLIFDTTRTINVFFLLATVGLIYFLLYLFLSWIFEIKEIYLISKLMTKAKEYQKKILEIYTSYE